jgi:hypothetical protein
VKIYRAKTNKLIVKGSGERPTVAPYSGTKKYTGTWNLCYTIGKDGSVSMKVVGNKGESDESYHRGSEIGEIIKFFKIKNPMLDGEYVITQSAPHSHSHNFKAPPPPPSGGTPPREGVPSALGIQQIKEKGKLV